MDTESEGEVGTSQSQSSRKKGHMINIYLTNLDEEAIVDFVKDPEKFKTMPDCLYERFASNRNLSV